MKFVDPKIDEAFKLLFGTPSNKHLLIDFLNAVLQLPSTKEIEYVEFLGNTISAENLDGNKVHIDIHCKDGQGNSYIVEMQVENQYNFVPRLEYYVSRALSLQKIKRGEYEKLLPVIGIGIVNFNLFDKKEHDSVISHYIFKEAQKNTPLAHSIIDIYFVELPKFKKTLEQLDTQLDKWLFFLKKAENLNFIPDQLKSLEDAFHVMNELTWDSAALARYRAEQDLIGKELRMQQGARLEGIQESKVTLAQNLLKKKMPLEFIMEVTELSEEEIQKIQLYLSKK